MCGTVRAPEKSKTGGEPEMRTRTRTRLVALVAAVLLGSATAAFGATGTIDIRQDAVAIQGGSAVLVFVEVECTVAENEVVLEGNISVSQDEASGLTGLNPICDGRRHVLPVRVETFGGTFDRGEAFASAFVLFLDTATGQTSQLQASETITIRGPARP